MPHFRVILSATLLAGATAGALAGPSVPFAAASAAAVPQADKHKLQAHIAFLADDVLEGRETGTRGFDIAASYVASQLRQYGVAPKGAPGSYLQPVPLRVTRLVQGSQVFELHGRGGKEALIYLDDYAMGGSQVEERSEVSAPLVFAGYGIDAERFKHDDYAGLDVKGKIVVVLAGKPSSFPTEEGAHFGSARHKRELAARHGAVGMISVQTPVTEKVSPFSRQRDNQNAAGMTWVDATGKPVLETGLVQHGASVSIAGAGKLFASAQAKLNDVYALAAANAPVPKMDLNLSARIARRSALGQLSSHNVVGMIEGSDPVLKHEYVVYSAHLDHIGVVKEKRGDNLYNGAMDNASGVATLLEAARMFAETKTRPKRSVLFIALTGEEKGLLGSDFFATNPTVPRGSIVANVNLDMPLLTFDFNNVVAFGAEHSSLKGIAERAVRKIGLSVQKDPWPEQGSFTRSDQYSFVRQGIPAISIKTGTGSFRKDEDPATLWAAFRSTHYHQPSDDLALPFNFDAAARFAQLNYLIALEIANAPTRPVWNRGDFFGDTFAK